MRSSIFDFWKQILPTLAIRSNLFKVVNKMTPKGRVEPEEMRRYLQSSRIGSIFTFFSKHPEETKDNKIMLKRTLERWVSIQKRTLFRKM